MAAKRIRRPRHPKPLFIAPPTEWEFAEGISIGACVMGFTREDLDGLKVPLNVHAHAHNSMKLRNGDPNELFGWMCFQSQDVLDQMRVRAGIPDYVVNSHYEIGIIGPHPTTSNMLQLITPSRVACHEYAHILAPHEVYHDRLKESPRFKGHGPLWQEAITQLGYPEEAALYADRFTMEHYNRSLGQAKRSDRW